ncbi:uncharacterized protein [Ptychodera flava]|uniref:uncharacterized protein isoform X1 n=1 Tax=Ptychodera flava TaxID=63121 RepID=UPI00396A3B83
MTNVPVIDFSAYSSERDKVDPEKLQKLVGDIDSAFRTNGIAYMVNHGVPREQIDEAFGHFRQFTQLPTETKQKYAREENGVVGYLGLETENLGTSPSNKPPDLKEVYNYDPNMKKKLIFTDEIENADKTLYTVWNELRKQFIRVLEIITLALNINDNVLLNLHKGIVEDVCKNNHTQLRYAFYPGIPEGTEPKKGQVRFGEHSDYGTVSFVVTDEVSGFEFQSTSGEWLAVPPMPDALIMMGCNSLQRFTSERYRAAPHRGVFSEGQDRFTDRQSIVFFGCPDDDAIVESLDGNQKYSPIPFLKYAEQLFLGNFNK